MVDNFDLKQKREQTLSIERINRQYLMQHLGGSLMQSLDKLPGIKAIGIGSGNAKPLIRGLGFNQVVVIENGLKHEGQQWGADHGLEIDQYAASDIEIIKGPGAFLYGSDAIAGAVVIQSSAPPATDTWGGSIDLTGKSNNNQWAVSANAYVRQKNWFMSARITATDYADLRVPEDTVYVYSYGVRLHNNRVRNTAGKERNLHLQTGWIGDKASTVFYASRIDNTSGFFANAHGLEPRRVDTDFHDRSSRDIQLPRQEVVHYKVINRTEVKLGDHTLEAQLGFQHNFRQEWNRYVNHGYMPAVYPDWQRIPINLEREYEKSVYSAQVKDTYTTGNHSLTIGASVDYQQNTIDGWSFLIPAFKQWQTGVYVHDKLVLSRNLTLQGALRYDYGQISIQEYADWFPTPVASGEDSTQAYLQRAANASRRFSSVNWSAGISYEPGMFKLKANVGSSFRMPIAKELGANGVNYHYFRFERGDINLSAEKSYQLDLSMGMEQKKWSVLISPYVNYFPNFIYLNPSSSHDYLYGAGNQVFSYAQSRVLRYGAELQVGYQINKSFSTTLSAEYLYNEQLSGSKQGYSIPFTPPPALLAAAKYQFQDINRLKNSFVAIDYRITARQNRIVPPERVTPGYQLLGLQAGTAVQIKQQQIGINLQVQNALNTKYLNHTSFYRLIALPEAGRNIVLSVHIPIGNKLSKHINR